MIPASESESALSTMNPLACAGFVVAAFLFSGAAHVLWLRSRLSLKCALPLDFGLSVQGKRIFGDHKMLRGFVVIVPATGASFGLLSAFAREYLPSAAAQVWSLSPWHYAVLGCWAGFGFMAGELPNSFIKRRLSIPPGGAASGSILRTSLFLADHLDSIVGMLLALNLIVTVPLVTWLAVIVVGIAIHCGFSALLFVCGVKERIL